MKKHNSIIISLILSLSSIFIWAQERDYVETENTLYQEVSVPSDLEYLESTTAIEENVITNKFETPRKGERTEIESQQREFKPDFKNNYKGEKFNYDRIVKPPKEPFIPNINIPPLLLKIVMYTILAVMILFIVYKIIKNAGGFNFGKVRKRIMVSASEDQTIEDQEDIENNDFSKLVQTAKENKDYRRAVRYYYLWILQKLSELKHIDWHKEKTNHDYYLELNQKTFQEDFFNSNFLFDYIWYGKFDLNSIEFEKAEVIFKKTLSKIK